MNLNPDRLDWFSADAEPVARDGRWELFTSEEIAFLQGALVRTAHPLATEIQHEHARRCKLAREGAVRTATGRVLTNADFEALADEAERGYDVDNLLERRERHQRGLEDQ